MLEDVGVDGERHIEGMRGCLPAPADDLAAERIAADGRVDALVDVVPLPSMEKTRTPACHSSRISETLMILVLLVRPVTRM